MSFFALSRSPRTRALRCIAAFIFGVNLVSFGAQSVLFAQFQPATTAPAGQQGRSVPAATPAGQNGTNGSNSQANPNETEAAAAARRAREDSERRDRGSNESQEVPTEFQRLVLASTGTNLPIFGQSLFNGVPSTFAPVDNIPVSPNYVIGPGDELRVQVFGAVNQQGNFVVNRNGNIAFPDVGDIHVAGIEYSQLPAFLKSQLSRVYRNFDLNVNLGQLRSIQIFVFGAARKPGAYTVSSLSTLLNAVFASGGPSGAGSLRDIQLKRNNQTLVHFDLYDLLLRGDKSKDIALQPGDVVFIPTVGPQVAITGSVNNPAIYEILPGTSVNELLQIIGGDTSVALGTRVRIERIFEHSMRSIMDLDLAKENPRLESGDIVTIGTILDRFKDAVTLRGNVAFPGRYVWHPGMRILDLVPTRDQLITREYYRHRNELGNITADYRATTAPAPTGALQLSGSPDTQAADAATQSGSTTASTKGGSSVGAALTAQSGVFAATNDVVLSAPDIDWSYAVIERLDPRTLTTSLIYFNPGKLYKDGDQSQNLELQSGDVITFFSTADLKVPTSQQTRIVHLEGEFVQSGVYSVEPGETLRHLIARVGGFTPDAYLYGSEFTRLSTRRVQQQRLNEYADNLEAQTSVYSQANQARAVSDRDTAATNAATVSAEQAIARLRRLVPLGRIVLEVKPDSRGVESLPDLPLEDGDRFVVPRVPSTVTVEGQVYSANSFVFQRGRKEHDYLRQAGGPDREADAKRTFILRADGSVFSQQYGNVDRATIFPGDTVVVPPQFDRHALLRNLLDFSSIIGQFGLGAAAINVLR